MTFIGAIPSLVVISYSASWPVSSTFEVHWLVDYIGGKAMHFITENELDNWVDGHAREAQGLIVELILKLVAASSANPRERRFPLGDSIGQHGPDGHLDAIISYEPYIPEGRSFWEIGTGIDAKAKAADDYKSLTEITPESVRKDSTFIFVTPRSGRRDWRHTWKEDGQISWIEEKKQANEWKDVRVIDGTKLVDWVHQFLPIELWLADKIGSLNQNQVETLEKKWELIESFGAPPSLSSALFLANRIDQCSKLSELFNGGNTFRIKLTTHFESEATNFVSAYIASLDEEKKQEALSRAVIVYGEDAWNYLCRNHKNLILVADPKIDLNSDHGAQLLQKARNANHSVVFSGPRGGTNDPNSVPLPMPKKHHVEEELKKIGYPEERSRALAQKCDGNLSLLLRYIQGLSGTPEWAQDAQGSDLKIIALLGAWNEGSDTDKVAIESITGKNYGEWVTKIRSAIASKPSTPLYFRDGKWKLISRYEGWFALGGLLSDSDLDQFQKVAIDLLKQKDQKFELDKDKRYAAQIYGKVFPYSKSLQVGIADTIALLGSHPEALTHCSSNKAEAVAKTIIREVFSNVDWQLWATLNGVIPLLAEAAPNEFLTVLENELTKDNSSLDDLFKQEGDGITGGIYTTGILWGLETLAWDSNFLSRVTLCLGQMAARDPGGQWSNRPSNSLRNIFLPWFPQTTATMEKRFLAVKSLLKESPTVGWKLILELLPDTYSSSSGGRKPAWRSSIPDDWKQETAHSDYWEQTTKYSELAIEVAKGHKTKLAELIEYLDGLPEAFHKVFLAYLGSPDFAQIPESDRSEVWDALMNVVGKHRRFSDTDWALPKEAIDAIAEVADIIAPSSPEFLYKRRFANRMYDELDDEKDSYENQMSALAKKQDSAALAIYSSGGINKIKDFITKVEMPYNVGRALGTVGPDEIDEQMLPKDLDNADRTVMSFISSFIANRFDRKGWTWIDGIISKEWSTEQVAKLLAYLPFTYDTWIKAEKLLGQNEELYWKKAFVSPYAEKNNLAFGINKLIEYGRPKAAIDCLYPKALNKEAIDEALASRALIAGLSSDEPANSMDGHHIVQVIKAIQNNPNTNKDDLFKIELGYLRLLDRSDDASPIVLEKRLAEDSDFFCEVIQLVFRSRNEPEKKEVKESNKNKEAFTTNCYQLLYHWQFLPGTLDDDSFDSSKFNEWLKAVKEKTKESGHFEVAMTFVGHVLFHAPADKVSGLWINEAVAEALNATDAQDMRDGFSTTAYNSRGVFYGSSGKQEAIISEAYLQQAVALEDKGYIRFATTLRNLSESYKKHSEAAAQEDEFDD